MTPGCLPSLNSWRSLGWTNSGLMVSNHQKSSAMNTITLCYIKSIRHSIIKCRITYNFFQKFKSVKHEKNNMQIVLLPDIINAHLY